MADKREELNELVENLIESLQTIQEKGNEDHSSGHWYNHPGAIASMGKVFSFGAGIMREALKMGIVDEAKDFLSKFDINPTEEDNETGDWFKKNFGDETED